jgi:hypothetical protein
MFQRQKGTSEGRRREERTIPSIALVFSIPSPRSSRPPPPTDEKAVVPSHGPWIWMGAAVVPCGLRHGLIIRSGPWCDPMAQGTSSHYVRHRKSSSGRSPSAGSLRARKTATSSRVFSLSATSFPTGHRSAARGLRAGPRQQVLAPTGAAASAVPLVNVSTTSGRSPTAE